MNSPINHENEVYMDLEKICWEGIKRAASESDWIPQEYFMNDWVSDVCSFLRFRNGEYLMEWQPITTAPQDGRQILVCGPETQHVVYWNRTELGWRWCLVESTVGWNDGSRPITIVFDDYLTHWQPLPALPTN